MFKFSLTLALALALVACGDSAYDGDGSTSRPAPSGLEKVFTSNASKDAKPAAAVRADAEDQSTVTVTGKVKDFTDKLAAFTVVDLAINSCADNPGDECQTPWDYCCEDPSHLKTQTITIEVHGDDGRPLREGLKGVKGLDHLDIVTVTGKVVRTGDNVSVVAESIHRQ